MKNKSLFLFIAFILLIFIAMKSDDEIPTITKEQQIKSNAGKTVRIVGIYRELNVAKAPDETLLYNGRAYIEIEDGGRIALDRGESGIRSKKEIEQYKDQTVIAKGLLFDNITLWGDGSKASIMMPCIIGAYVMSEETEKLLTEATDLDDLSIIKKKEEIEQHKNEKVLILGTYKKLYLPIKKKRPGEKEPKKEFSGRACIELDDHTEIAIEVNDKGLRSIEEIKKFENKKVSISGIISRAPLWGDGKEASIVMYAIQDVKLVKLVELVNIDDPSIITHKEELANLNGKEITLQGIYQRREIKKLVPHGKNKDGSLIYGGTVHTCAYIELSDHTMIMLGIGSEIIRKEGEVETYKNKKVIIKGTYYKDGWKLLGDTELSKANIPYIENIKDIEFADVNHLPLIISINFITHNFTYSNLAELDSQIVQIEGIYKQEEVGKGVYHKNPNDPPHYTGNVCIQLADSSKIFLETGKEGIRSTEEIKKLENKKVFVIGTLYKNHELFEGPENILVNCIKKITTIELKENE